jgi:hypothetical protein
MAAEAEEEFYDCIVNNSAPIDSEDWLLDEFNGRLNYMHKMNRKTKHRDISSLRSEEQLAAYLQFGSRRISGYHEGTRFIVKELGKTKYSMFKDVTFGAKKALSACGNGVFSSDIVCYKGEFLNNQFHDINGTATFEVVGNWKYFGGFYQGKRHGDAQIWRHDDKSNNWVLRYKGTFQHDKPHNGSFFDDDGVTVVADSSLQMPHIISKQQSVVKKVDVDISSGSTVPSDAATSEVKSLNDELNEASSPVQPEISAESSEPDYSPTVDVASTNDPSADIMSLKDNALIIEILENPKKKLSTEESVDALTACLKSGAANAQQVIDKELIIIYLFLIVHNRWLI